MTIPKWLLPVFAIITALAVGVAATLIGLQLRPEQPPTTQTVPVIEPVAVGDGAMPTTDDDPETLDVSQSVGEAEIVTPGILAEGELSAGTEARIDALDAADGMDEGTAREVIAATDDPADAAAGDPCSPPDGSTPEGCPEGLHSVILALTEPEPLRLFPRADPPTVLAGSGGLVACPAAPDGSLSFGVATTIPAQVTVRYWPVSDPAAEQSVSIGNVPEEVAAWDAVIAADGGFRPGYGLFQHCTNLPALRPATDYEASILAIDIFDRIESVSYGFDSRGTPVRPPMVLQPLGPSLLYVSVPATAGGPLPWVRAWTVDPGDPADCSTWEGEREIERVVDEGAPEVSAAYLAAHNYGAAYTRRVTNVFSAPEGSVIVVCARWYDREAPSWSRDIPTQQLSAVAMSPDTVSPVVRVTGLALARAVDERAIRLSATTQLGGYCGPNAYLPDLDADTGATLDVDQVLCAPGDSAVSFRESGSVDNIVVTSLIAGAAGPVTTSRMLPLSRYNCTGVCELPPTLTYEVLLPNVTVGTGLCGSSFGESCTPPTREIALGTATITVTWEQGAMTGAEEWQVGEPALVTPEVAVLDHPQLDIFQVVTAQVDPSGFFGTLRVPVRVDRPASYRVSVDGPCFADGPIESVIGETVVVDGGGFGADLQIYGVCAGERYQVSVELTDADGGRATYGPGQPYPFNWSGGEASVPWVMLDVEGTVLIANVADGPRPWWTTGADITIDGSDRISADFPDDVCFTRAELSTLGTFGGTTRLIPVVHLHVAALATTEGMYTGVNRDTTCSWADQTWNVTHFDLDVPYGDLLRGITVTQGMRPGTLPETIPWETEFEATLTIRAIRP